MSTLTAAEFRVLDEIYETMPLIAMLPDRPCYETATAVERRLGWTMVGGYHDVDGSFWGREGHYWNVMPDGTIVDAAHEQFDDDEPIMIAEVGSPEAARYVRGGLEDHLLTLRKETTTNGPH